VVSDGFLVRVPGVLRIRGRLWEEAVNWDFILEGVNLCPKRLGELQPCQIRKSNNSQVREGCREIKLPSGSLDQRGLKNRGGRGKFFGDWQTIHHTRKGRAEYRFMNGSTWMLLH